MSNSLLPEDVAKLEKELATLDYIIPDKTQTIKQILRDKGTSCWGISRIALNRLRKAGLDPETVYIEEDDNNMRPTHQFTTYKDGDKYWVYDHFVPKDVLEALFDSREAAIDDRVKRWREEENHTYPVTAYTGEYLPKSGLGFEEYMGAITRKNKLLKRYPALEKQSMNKELF